MKDQPIEISEPSNRKGKETEEQTRRTLPRWKFVLGRTGDLIVNFTLIFPLTIAFWRGVWQLVDCYCDKAWDPWISLSFGYLVLIVLYVLQDPLNNLICPDRLNSFLYNSSSRFILLLHATADVIQWRGLWKLLEIYIGSDVTSALISLLLGLALSLPLKTFSSALTPPIFCLFDEFPALQESPLRFNSRIKTIGLTLYTLDCLLTVTISLTAVSCCWRGCWILLDLYLFPNDPQMSMETSLCSGILICIVMCVLQPFLKRSQCSLSLKGLARLGLVYLSYFVAFAGCVLAWRGLWNFYNIYFVFHTPCLSQWVTSLLGAFGGISVGCMSTIIVRLRSLDGQVVEGWLISSITLRKI